MINLISKSVSEINNKLVKHRRAFHQNPEKGFETTFTTKYITETLSALGAECYYIGKGSVVTEISVDKAEKTLLLRADIDALPIEEQTNLEFTAKNGCMHACGHDMHAAMLLGAYEVLAKIKDKLRVNVRFLFQPGEEILQGANDAVNAGVLDGVDCAMTLHVMTNSPYPTGCVMLSYDSPIAPSADFFRMTVSGKGCHGSSPCVGIDPISCACRIVNDVGHIKTHEIGIHEKAVLTFGSINGGIGANAIPDEVVLRGTLRCFDENTRSFYKTRFEEISNGIAGAFRCKASIEYTSSCPSLSNDKELLEKTAEDLSALLGRENVIRIKDTKSKVQGSEDFAYIAEKVPSVSVAICAGSEKDGYTLPLHNPSVTFDERALETGCLVYCAQALLLG